MELPLTPDDLQYTQAYPFVQACYGHLNTEITFIITNICCFLAKNQTYDYVASVVHPTTYLS